jgi:hypothetical protein
MSMTNASMDEQTRPSNVEATAAEIEGMAVSNTDNLVIATPKPADSNWNHCDVPNDYKNTQNG